MGFGLLFFGYFLEFLLGMNKIGVFTHVIGYMVIFVGLSRLRLYCHTFRYALYTTGSLLIVAVYRTFADLPELFDVSFPFVTSTLTLIFTLLDSALVLLFHVFLAIALMEICKRTGVTKNAIRALQTLVIVVIHAGVNAYVTLAQKQNTPMYGLMLLLQLLWVICNLVLLGSCYMRICPAGQENAVKESKPSRFAFVNNIREKYRRSEEKAIREDSAYRAEKFNRNIQKQNQHTSPKPSSRAAKRAEVQAARDAARRKRGE